MHDYCPNYHYDYCPNYHCTYESNLYDSTQLYHTTEYYIIYKSHYHLLFTVCSFQLPTQHCTSQCRAHCSPQCYQSNYCMTKELCQLANLPAYSVLTSSLHAVQHTATSNCRARCSNGLVIHGPRRQLRVPESSSEVHEFGLAPVILIQSVILHLTRLFSIRGVSGIMGHLRSFALVIKIERTFRCYLPTIVQG